MTRSLLNLVVPKSAGIKLLLTFLLLVSVLFVSVMLTWDRQALSYRDTIPDRERFITDFAPVIGNQWQTSEISNQREDLLGWASSLLGSSSMSNYINATGNPVYVAQHVSNYMGSAQALERYHQFDERIFNYQFGVPPSRQQYPYQDLEFVTSTNPNADESRIACSEVFDDSQIRDVQCGGLFLYDDYLVYIDVFTKRDFIEYLTTDDLVMIFSSIDAAFEG
jgi:hypothetical protein